MSHARARGRVHARRGGAPHDALMVCMASAASACVLAALVILIVRPTWESPLLMLPLGAYMIGGLGGVLTTAAAPGWARRLGSRHSGRVVGVTYYRLLCACLAGALGYILFAAGSRLFDYEAPDLFLYFGSLLFGTLERVANMAVLAGLGVLGPADLSSRLP